MTNVLAFVILFGVLVFVHELGHFLMAKFFRVGVEKFSLGYGPRLFGKKWGETDYMISALPLGGYVKMIGDEPVDEMNAQKGGTSLAPNSFMAKPAWQRILIVLMGPIANLILPIVLYFCLFTFGQPFLTTEIGFVRGGSVAERAGIKPGDRITSINQTPVKEWGEMSKIIQESGGKALALGISRYQGKETLHLQVTPEVVDGQNTFGEPIKMGAIGINPTSFLPVVHLVGDSSVAYKAGLRTGDHLVGVRYPWEFSHLVESARGKEVQFEIERDKKRQTLTLAVPADGTLAGLGIYFKEMVIESVMPSSVAEEKGIKSKDILFAINGAPLPTWFDFQDKISNNQGEAMSLTVVRDGKPITLDVSPRVTEQQQELTGEKIKRRLLGVTSSGDVRQDTVEIERVFNPIRAIQLSTAKVYEICELTVVGFAKLVTGKVSSKSVGGPLLIYQLAGKSWESGFYTFINTIVLISITLGIMNLLPIPVLDGGHLMFYSLEMILGRPVRPRTREWLQQIGIILLLGLMIFAFYNDLSRVAWQEVRWLNWLKSVF